MFKTTEIIQKWKFNIVTGIINVHGWYTLTCIYQQKNSTQHISPYKFRVYLQQEHSYDQFHSETDVLNHKLDESISCGFGNSSGNYIYQNLFLIITFQAQVTLIINVCNYLYSSRYYSSVFIVHTLNNYILLVKIIWHVSVDYLQFQLCNNYNIN